MKHAKSLINLGFWTLAAIFWVLLLLTGCTHLQGIGQARGEQLRQTTNYRGDQVFIREH